ncbi:ABC transporter permease, partial [Pseudomonas helleri]
MAGDAQLDTSSNPARLIISGQWTLANYARLKKLTEQLAGKYDASTHIDLDDVSRLDTAGASLLVELLGAERVSQLADSATKLPEADRALLQTVYSSMRDFCVPVKAVEINIGLLLLSRIGSAVYKLWQDTLQLLGFIGVILQSIARNLLRPKQWRVTPVVAQIEQIGLNATPIVALLTFMVGAVVAFLGATVLANFGAGIYTVDLVAFSFLREFGVLLTAIL